MANPALMKAKRQAKSARRKKCTGCGYVKPTDEFGSHDSSSDGYTSRCNSCRNERSAQYRRTNTLNHLRHHIATRIITEAEGKYPLPEGFTRNLEKHLGYKIWKLRKFLIADLELREGITLQTSFDRGYHLDHRIPLSSYSVSSVSSEAFRQCWAISNLRMIPALENLQKGAKILQ